MLALLAAIDLQGGAPCWTLPSPTLLVLLRRYECPVTCAQVSREVELPMLDLQDVLWSRTALCRGSRLERLLLLPLPLADSGMKVNKWEYMKHYILSQGEDGACSVMMPPAPTTSSTTTTMMTTSSNVRKEGR
ncbi:uncharacterized protein [Triticum aestivum]|uniref:uncharacterized protein isoform X3 n=1 Tax=Triticum aestivum TaxID=4565 RepID=UPI001D020D75|nr:uncharacterized protein LOC123190596 isoform X3 [Triticum aestivum]